MVLILTLLFIKDELRLRISSASLIIELVAKEVLPLLLIAAKGVFAHCTQTRRWLLLPQLMANFCFVVALLSSPCRVCCFYVYSIDPSWKGGWPQSCFPMDGGFTIQKQISPDWLVLFHHVKLFPNSLKWDMNRKQREGKECLVESLQTFSQPRFQAPTYA